MRGNDTLSFARQENGRLLHSANMLPFPIAPNLPNSCSFSLFPTRAGCSTGALVCNCCAKPAFPKANFFTGTFSHRKLAYLRFDCRCLLHSAPKEPLPIFPKFPLHNRETHFARHSPEATQRVESSWPPQVYPFRKKDLFVSLGTLGVSWGDRQILPISMRQICRYPLSVSTPVTFHGVLPTPSTPRPDKQVPPFCPLTWPT